MHLQTTLIISSSNCSFKTNHRSQFSNFSHPLKVLQKTDNQMLEMTKQLDKGIKNVGNDVDSGMKSKQKNTEYFNEDEGILEHIHKQVNANVNHTASSSPKSGRGRNVPRLTKQWKPFNAKQSPFISLPETGNKQKCFVLFGFSINLLQIQNFHSLHPQLNLSIKLYRYDDSDYFKQIDIKSQEEQSFEENSEKFKKIIQALNGEDLFDCEEITFVVSFWESQHSIYDQNCTESSRKNRIYVYFFPNINALKSDDQKRQDKTQLTLGFLPPSSTNNRFQQNSARTTSPQPPCQSLTSLRKSHQNFRILQVLEYYLKLECHSQYIMITSNESRVMKEFMDLIYENQIKDFFICIDHERRSTNRTCKSTVRSILANRNTRDHCLMKDSRDNNEGSFYYSPANKQQKGYETPMSTSKVFTSDISSEKQFISIDGQLIINDEFLSKLSELKLSEPWLDNCEFRQQKKLMYKMKLQEYNQNKQLKRMKDEFTDMINYLNSLIGAQKVTYDEISIDSLQQIKNAKIRQATQQVKELKNVWQQKEIRSEELKQKIKLYENEKHAKNEDREQNLSQLRKEILTVQKQLNLQKNQLNAIYHMECNKDQKDIKQRSSGTETLTTLKTEDDKKLSSQVRSSKDNHQSEKVVQKAKDFNKTQGLKSVFRGHQPSAQLQPKANVSSATSKLRNMVIKTTIPTSEKQESETINTQKSPLPNLKSPLRAESFLVNRKSSQMLSKYAPILEQLRKQKYEQSLKQEMTKCEFQAQKQFEKYKEDYRKAVRELRLVLNDCD